MLLLKLCYECTSPLSSERIHLISAGDNVLTVVIEWDMAIQHWPQDIKEFHVQNWCVHESFCIYGTIALSEIWGSQGGEDVSCSLLGYDAM
jgi:hypothetical protein